MAVTFPLVASIVAAFCKWQSLELCRSNKGRSTGALRGVFGPRSERKDSEVAHCVVSDEYGYIRERREGQNIVGF